MPDIGAAVPSYDQSVDQSYQPPGGTLPQLPGGAPPGYGTMAVANDPNAVNDPYAATSLLGGNVSSPDDPYVRQLAQFGQSLGGGSPLEQMQQLQSRRSAATEQAQAAIQRAYERLAATKAGENNNLPMLAFAAGIGGPTHSGTFSEAFSRALGAAYPAVQQQREQDWQQARELGQLQAEPAQLGLQVSQQDYQDFLEKMRLAEQAQQTSALVGGRSDIATMHYQEALEATQQRNAATVEAARIRAGGVVDAAGIRSQANQWSFAGVDPNDPNKGVWFNKTTGSVNFGPAAMKGVSPVDQKGLAVARTYLELGQAHTMADAYKMAKAGGDPTEKNAAQINKELNAQESKLLANTEWSAGKTPQDVENEAWKYVWADRARATAGPPGAAKPAAPAAPTPGGAHAAAPAAGGEATRAAPTTADIDGLKTHPETAPDFIKKFGAQAYEGVIGAPTAAPQHGTTAAPLQDLPLDSNTGLPDINHLSPDVTYKAPRDATSKDGGFSVKQGDPVRWDPNTKSFLPVT